MKHLRLKICNSPQGTTFYDTEGISYVGGGRFVLSEERYRQLDLFTYVAGGTLTAADAQTVKLGTTIGNIGNEGVSYDPQTTTDPNDHGFLVVKEKQPEGIFQTNVDFAAGTATNGSPTTDEPTNLFDPSLAGLNDFSDVFALSNLPDLTGPDSSHLLIISQESGKIENVDRSGNVESSLTIEDPGSPLSVVDETHEGVTMDRDGTLYTVDEDGGGDFNHPQLWVYKPSTAPDQAPTAVKLVRQVNSVPADTNTSAPVKVADVDVIDDGLGTNNLTVTGPDAADFQVDQTGLYLKTGTSLTAGATFTVSVAVDDPAIGPHPAATSDPFTLTVTAAGPVPTGVFVSEVAPWGSGNSPYAVDWFELTNSGPTAVSLANWSMDDNSNNPADAVSLLGVPSIPPGKSAVFFEDTGNQTDAGDAAIEAAFAQAWFGSPSLPEDFLIGHYGGSGVGLSTGGDAVNIFNSSGAEVTGVAFGASPSNAPFATFDNSAGAGSTTLPLPVISTLSAVGVSGAFKAADGQEIGSPGLFQATAPPPASSVIVSEVSPWGSGNAPYAVDWFELTNTGTSAVDLTGWKMDDSSDAFSSAVPLAGMTSLPAGKSAVFFEDTGGLNDATVEAAFAQAWFGTPALPDGFLIGHYGGSGVGLSTGGDAVNVFDAVGDRVTGLAFGNSPSAAPFATFDNTAGAGSTTLPLPVLTTLSAKGVNGAYVSADDQEIGSPGGPVTDTTQPVTTATAAPAADAFGWNNSAVTVSFSCTDGGTGVDPAASQLASQVLTASGTATGSCTDRAGNTATVSYTAQIDTTAPTVTYSGNAGTYPLLSNVAIACTADDDLSGVASSTCASTSGPAWSFGPGAHTLSASATDKAGNTGAGTATFTVTVKPADLCTLTRQFVQSSAKYQQANALTKLAASALVTTACNVILDFTPNANPTTKAKLITSYSNAVQAIVKPGWLTAAQATTLSGLAGGI